MNATFGYRLPLLLLLIVLLFSSGCATLSSAPAVAPAAAISVSISPPSSRVTAGGSAQFSATVSNTSNTAVDWLVNGVAGGNSSAGTISASGMYTAPTTVSSQMTVTVTAVSKADGTQTANAQVTIMPAVEVTISPASVSLTANATQQFTATVSHASNTGVTWQVNGVTGGNATTGTISSSGFYTAPSAVANQTVFTVTAISQADASKSASTHVTVGPAPPGVSVAISPTSQTLTAAATQQFTATVSNDSNTAVTWQVDGVQGGSPATGAISSAGLYTAPASIATQTLVTVTAVSQADTSKSASAQITLNPPPSVTVTISPTTKSLTAGATQQFTASVVNSSNTAVTWKVNGILGGSATSGTISTSGLYTAPSTISTQTAVTVTATSAADPTKSASAQVTLNLPLAVAVTISPTSKTLSAGGTQQFTATVSNSSNTAVTWQVNGVTGGNSTTGTISTSGLYTGPAAVSSQTVVTVTAVSQADATKSASAQVTLNPPPSLVIVISPTSKTLSAGGTQQFTATVSNNSNTAVNWQVNGVTGGNSTTGSISTSGLYTAPATIASQTVITVTAVSQADSTKAASAQVTLNPPAPVTIVISPTVITVAPSGTQQFNATVSNSSNTAVTWQVNNVTGGNSTTGTVSAAGLYTAPASIPSPATVTVTAISQADTTKSAPAQVTIASPPVVTGNSFYVATTGNDSNLGTIDSPWKTISHAASSGSGVHAGDTVFVRGGSYKESVTIALSGSASGPIVFQSYPGEAAIVDGTGLTPPTDQHGLFNIESRSYVTISGFEIRNYQTSSSSAVPAGIWVTGSGSHIQLLKNKVHDIKTSSEANGNAFGIAIYGSEAPASLDSITIDGNEVYNLRTGGSESVNVDGNVTNFVIANNIIHDNDNIAIDAIGFEGVSSNSAYDYARNGVISGNTIYNISGSTNPGEGNDYDANGIYVDGGSQILIENNLIHHVDIGIEVASENRGRVSSFVTVRNNVIYSSNTVGISIGGYASNTGGTDNCVIVNNTLYNNDTKQTGSGEFQVQYYSTNNVFKNNIVYASSQGLFINNYTNSSANPVDADYNLYFSSVAASSAEFLWNGSDYSSFSAFQTATGKDGHSRYLDPMFLSLASPNLKVAATSPAVGFGINLGSAIVGSDDFAGNPRVQGSAIDIGAFEQ